jgi:hypothetical protein
LVNKTEWPTFDFQKNSANVDPGHTLLSHGLSKNLCRTLAFAGNLHTHESLMVLFFLFIFGYDPHRSGLFKFQLTSGYAVPYRGELMDTKILNSLGFQALDT